MIYDNNFKIKMDKAIQLQKELYSKNSYAYTKAFNMVHSDLIRTYYLDEQTKDIPIDKDYYNTFYSGTNLFEQKLRELTKRDYDIDMFTLRCENIQELKDKILNRYVSAFENVSSKLEIIPKTINTDRAYFVVLDCDLDKANWVFAKDEIQAVNIVSSMLDYYSNDYTALEVPNFILELKKNGEIEYNLLATLNGISTS